MAKQRNLDFKRMAEDTKNLIYKIVKEEGLEEGIEISAKGKSRIVFNLIAFERPGQEREYETLGGQSVKEIHDIAKKYDLQRIESRNDCIKENASLYFELNENDYIKQ